MANEKVASVFLDYVKWLRRDGTLKQLDDTGLFGHLEVDYSNLHVVAAILTQAELSRPMYEVGDQ